MRNIEKAYKEAHRKTIALYGLSIIIGYFIYYSIVEYSLVSIIVSSIGFLFILYLIIMREIFNRRLGKLKDLTESNPKYVLEELRKILNKVDKHNEGFASNVKGSFVKGTQAQGVRNKLQDNQTKHNKIAKLISLITVYQKQNNIK